jgi:hypothetical protein
MLLIRQEIVFGESGDSATGVVHRLPDSYSVEFLWMLKVKGFCGWYDEGVRICCLRAGRITSRECAR